MTFQDVVMECFENTELRQQFERLYLDGKPIVDYRPPRNGLEALVDKAAGYGPTVNEEAGRKFIKFVWNFVWTRLPPERFTDDPAKAAKRGRR